jgi:hypothetical protein
VPILSILLWFDLGAERYLPRLTNFGTIFA